MSLNNAELIKESVDIRDVCELYGVNLDNRGRGLCPFHDDKRPSASVKNNRFHCYVCNLHLDIFDFVMQITGCDFKTAMETLNSVFGLGLDMKKPIASDEMRRIKTERQRKADELKAYRADYNVKQAEFIRLRQKPLPAPESPEMGAYAFAMGRIEELEEYFILHPWR